MLAPFKFSYFNFFASLFEPFLKKYQSDAPMIPFLYSGFVALFHSILELAVKPDILNECPSGKNIMKLNLDKDLSF